VLWNIGDLDVVVEGLSEIVKLFFESFTFLGFLESFGTSFKGSGFFVMESLFPGLFVGAPPFGLLKSLVLISNIIEFIFEFSDLGVVNVESLIVVVDGSI